MTTGGPAPGQGDDPSGYPRDLESEVILADGRVALLRPIVPSDGDALRSFAGRLSAETVYFRFFSPRRGLTDAEVRHFTHVDYEGRLAIVAFVDGELVAVARYERLGDGNEAEVAFTVRDDQQGRGLGTVLLEHLASAALAKGITTFVADTLPENARMLGVFREVGLVETARFDSGVIRVSMLLDPAPGYADKVEARDAAAAARSIARILEPSSVAVIGASPRRRTIGYALVANLVAGGFTGPVYPVHPTAPEVLGLEAYPSITKVPGHVDLAVVAVPAASVPAVVEECGRAGCGGLVVVSAGFAETGPEGAVAERELVASSRRHGMRLVGPNCMGVINTAEAVRLDATFAPVTPVPGRIAFCSQSDGLGVAILGEASRRGLGISSFVSVGNKADVSSNDLIRYWERDPGTDVILLYLESFGNPRHFSRIARRVARRRPIIAVKSGRSPAGSRGTTSHTASAAAPDDVVDALFRQAGVIRVDTLEELFDVAELVHHQPLPAGGSVGILGNSGGPSVLAADACEARGLDVPVLSEVTQDRLRQVLGGGAAVRNPVDCNPAVTPQQYAAALQILLGDDGIDAVISIFTPPLASEAEDVAGEVARIASGQGKPVVTNFLATGGTLEAFRTAERPVPWFAYPESAARALAKVVPYAAWRADAEQEASKAASAGPGAADEPAGLDAKAGRRIVTDALARATEHTTTSPATGDGGVLSPEETSALLSAYGIDLGSGSTAGGAGATSIPHAVPAVSIRLLEDPLFGPVVSVGLTGLASDVFGDRQLRLVPFTEPEALGMISSLKASSVLQGASADLPALAGLLCRVGRLGEDLPEVVRLDLDPVWPGTNGSPLVGGAEVVVQAVSPEPVLRRRHLR